MMCKALFIFLFTFGGSIYLLAQNAENKPGNTSFLQAEVRLGKTIESTTSEPMKRQFHTFFAFGKTHLDTSNPQAVFLRFPSTGLQLGYSNFGNQAYLGHGVNVLPFIEIRVLGSPKHHLGTKLGLGLGAITKVYDQESNPGNKAVGSHLNWNFEAFLQYRVPLGKRDGLRVGFGFVHYSNGHTKLPNLGLNSFAANLSFRWREFAPSVEPIRWQKLPRQTRSRRFFLFTRIGLGFHEFGGRDFPIGGENKLVFAGASGLGWTFRQAVRMRLLLGYRFYQAYFDHIKENPPNDYSDHRLLNSMNLYFGMGGELLIGHVGIDLEGGINLWKPYYRVQWELFESKREEELYYQLKNLFLLRIGLNLYLISTRKDPRNNVFIGAYINTNYEQADFTEISIGYLYKPGKRYSKKRK